MHLGFYKLVKNFLSTEQCSKIIESLPIQEEIRLLDSGLSTIGTWHKNKITDQRCSLNVDNNLLKLLEKFLPNDLSYVSDRMYVTKYDTEQKCTPHIDPADITAIILLNNNFDGGELIINKKKVPLEMGDAIIFSDKLVHSVNKITNGTRYALSIWLNIQTNNKGKG